MSNKDSRTGLVVAGVMAFFVTAIAIALFVVAGLSKDSSFAAFYLSATRWLQGGPMYAASDAANPNLLTPIATAILVAPLVRVFPAGAVPVAWSLLGLLALAASVRAIAMSGAVGNGRLLRAVIVLAVSAGAFHVWSQGQVTWVLMYPFTRAWLALRDGRLISAGLWLAPVIVAKPIFVAVALFWPWRTWLMTGVASLMIALTGVAWLSLATWIAWLEGGSHVAWISYPLNASVWGLLARVQTGGLHEGTLSDVMAFSPILLVIIAGAAAAAAWRIARDRDADRRTTAGVLLMLLLSPLGWVYYLPIAFGPFVTTLPITRLTVTALALHLIPMVVFLPSMATTPVILQTIGSVYTIGLMLALLETIRRPRSVAASSPVSV